MRLIRAVAGMGLALFVTSASPASFSQTVPEPVIGVWYRGVPAGTPRAGDVAAIRALGFNGIAWPREYRSSLDSVKKIASGLGLTVLDSETPVHVTPVTALAPGARVDVRADGMMSALAWRAFAHGARTILFDAGSGEGAGLESADRELQPWVTDARAIARQVTVNARLAAALRPGPGVVVWPDQSPALDVVMLDADRSWALFATNASAEPRKASARLPAGAPYAIWISWIDGSALSMIGEAPGPRWTFEIAPGAARVYLIDKVTKLP